MFRHARPLLPRTFWRFFLPTLCVVAAAFVAATAITYFTGLSIFTANHARSAGALLASAASGYRHAVSDIDEFRRHHLALQRAKLREALSDVAAVCSLYRGLAASGRLGDDEAQRLALAWLRASPASGQSEPAILAAAPDGNGGYRLLAVNRPMADAPSQLLRDLEAARAAASGDGLAEPPFLFATSVFSERTGMSPHLATAVRFEPWNWLLVAGLSMNAYKLAVAEKESAALRGFGAYLLQVASDMGGELVVFGEQCEVAATSAPAMEHHRLGGVWTDRCRAMIAAAGKNGEDRQPAQGSLAQPANKGPREVFWSMRIPGESLYAGFVIPGSLLAASAREFVDTLVITGLSAVVVLGLALTLLLAGLLGPVTALTDAYRRVMSGDFTVRADENIPGEIGDLCRQFNAMARSLQELLQTEQLRQVELDEVNKTLENQVRLRTEALANKARELEEANRRLQEMDLLKTNFLQNVSHELRTPLTAVLGFAKLIHKDFQKHFAAFAKDDLNLFERSGRLLRNLEIIISEGERLTRLINDVLDLAKIESGRMDWNDETVDMSPLLLSVAETFRSRSVESGVELNVQVPDGLPRVVADRDRFTQVMINLLDNAFKFTAAGEVRLQARERDGQLCVEVGDTGMGIAADELAKVFDKFHQTSRRDTLRDKPPGTGLGLAICRQIVLRYGGRISAASRPGEGTTISVVLPAARLAPQAEEA